MKKLILIFLLLCATAFGAWDNDKPADNRVWNLAAGDIRDNNDAIEAIWGVGLVNGMSDRTDVTNVAYGATGDGSTDDTSAINAALTAAGTGSSVWFPPGTYIVSSITPLDGQTLHGVRGGSILKRKAAAGTSAGVITLSGDTNVTIKNLTIDGNYLNATQGAWYGIDVTSASDYCTIDNVEVINCRRDATNDVACVRILSSDFAKISNCRLDNSNNNLLLFGASYCTIDNCSFEDNFLSEAVSFFGPTGFTTTGNTITNCTFKDCRQAFINDGATYTAISNLVIENSSDVAFGINNGKVSVTNVQIKQGTDATIYAVSIGQTQTGDITTDDPISLTDVSVDVNGEPFRGFHIASSNPDKVTLTNCHVYNSGSAVASGTQSAFFIQAATDIDLIGCTARDTLGSGFELLSGSGVTNKNIKLIGCTASDNGIDGINVLATAVENLQVIGGTYKNNSQTSAGTDHGIFINSVGNTGVIIDGSVQVFDDQGSATQAVPGIVPPAIPAIADDATPSVLNGTVFLTGGTTTITDFDDGIEGQEITIIAEHTLIITDGTNIFTPTGGNLTMNATDILRLIQKADGKWYTISYSDNT